MVHPTPRDRDVIRLFVLATWCQIWDSSQIFEPGGDEASFCGTKPPTALSTLWGLVFVLAHVGNRFKNFVSSLYSRLEFLFLNMLLMGEA